MKQTRCETFALFCSQTKPVLKTRFMIPIETHWKKWMKISCFKLTSVLGLFSVPVPFCFGKPESVTGETCHPFRLKSEQRSAECMYAPKTAFFNLSLAPEISKNVSFDRTPEPEQNPGEESACLCRRQVPVASIGIYDT